MFDWDGFDDYNGIGAAPGVQANYALSGSGTSSLLTGRFGVGQRWRFTGGSAGNPRWAIRQLPSAASTLTIGHMLSSVSAPPSSASVWANLMLYQAGTAQVGWRTDSNGAILVYRMSSQTAGTLLGQSANGVIVDGQEYYAETTFVIHDTTGSVLIRLNGTDTVVNLTGLDTKNHATLATADQFQIGANAQETIEFDDLYWRDDATMLGDSRCEQLNANSDGATLNFTPSTGSSHFGVVDEAVVDVSDYLSGSNVGDVDELGLTDMSNTPTTIHGVKGIDWALKTDAAARST